MVSDVSQLDLSITVGGASFSGAGDPERVMAALERFSELVTSVGGVDVDVAPEPRQEPPGRDKAKGNSSAKKAVLPIFLQERNPKGNPQIATAIVAWAELHDGKARLAAPRVRELWRKTTFRAPGNVNRDLEKAVQQGYLHRDGSEYSATGYGKTTLGLQDN